MLNLGKWCLSKTETEGDHEILVLSGVAAQRQMGIDNCAAAVPSHYGNPAFAAKLFKKLGKTKAAGHLEAQLPKSEKLRSGDLGEILATHYVAEHTTYTHFIKRLRFKDHREMAMRGDDLVAVRSVGRGKPLEFLKAEVKSRAAISSSVLDKARTALRNNHNRPSPHALTFISERLSEQGQDAVAAEIAEAQLSGIKLPQIEHMLFTFSENDPLNLLKKNLAKYTGKVAQMTVGLYVDGHQKFIRAVFEKVIANGKKP